MPCPLLSAVCTEELGKANTRRRPRGSPAKGGGAAGHTFKVGDTLLEVGFLFYMILHELDPSADFIVQEKECPEIGNVGRHIEALG
jgi:hypothetical protein